MLLSLVFLAGLNTPLEDERQFDGRHRTTEAPRLRATVRVGASQEQSETRQELCLSVSPVTRWSLESCGTGAGFLSPTSASPDLAHFRLRYRAWSRNTQRGWLFAGLQAGFAELEIGEDDPGFHFSSVGPRGLETAGPSAGASLRWTRPLRRGLHFIGEFNTNLAYFPHAPDLQRPLSIWHPSLSLSIGLGF